MSYDWCEDDVFTGPQFKCRSKNCNWEGNLPVIKVFPHAELITCPKCRCVCDKQYP